MVEPIQQKTEHELLPERDHKIMNTTKQYMIDDTFVNSDELIERAKTLGYTGDEYGTFYTNGSARVLRDHGYTVGNNPDYQKEENV